jgi:hypothetical protein
MLDWFEIEELAIHLCGLPEDAESEDIEEALYDKFEISFDQFHRLAAHLVPLCMIAESPLSKKVYRGFGADGTWLAKQELPAHPAAQQQEEGK